MFTDAACVELYLGLNPGTGKQRWAARTVHGSRRYAQAQLALLVDEAQAARTHAGTVTDLLQRWFTAASPNWAVSTVRETRSLIRCHLDPHLGHLPVAKLTTADIDDLYAHLLRAGGRDGRPLAPGTVGRWVPAARRRVRKQADVAKGRGGRIDAGRVDESAEAPGRTGDLGREPVYQELLRVRTPTPTSTTRPRTQVEEGSLT